VELQRDHLAAILARPNVLLLVGCGLQEPGNLGSIMRSAQALGASASVTLEETVSPFNPKAVRASAGAVFRLPFFAGQTALSLFPRLRAAGVAIVAADRHCPSPLAQADLRGSVAFLIGKEATGLRPEILREANLLLSIPIRPGTDSMNAAAAAAIFLYEAARQRGFKY
ncbi:MAG: RNA methyltransferase, partial [Acidobacteria bacterium]|nr:RNA methyltransferase [Acidobacteriota bacterium]